MSASAHSTVAPGRPTLSIRGTPYPVLLPTLRDPRLHLAAVIVSLQVLGQVAFDFRLSIAQILVSLLTCAVLEVGIAFRRQHVILWPASALLTGNGVAFILRVPGTQHGDWWSMNGWWIFAATSAVALLSKYVIRFRGKHVFNPSNFGLVLSFLILGSSRADPLEFWWSPMSVWLVLAVAIIVAGGLAILRRLGLLAIAIGFWLAFAAGIGVLALSGHEMTARWHLGAVSGGYFWRTLVFSPEILVFLFFMITDPKTVPEGRVARRVYAVSVALIAVLLIAPQGTEFASKVAVLGALALVCGARPLIEYFLVPAWKRRNGFRVGTARRATVGALALAGAVGFAGLLVLAGIPARNSAGAASPPIEDATALPPVTILASTGVASQIDRPTAQRIARDVVADLRIESDALRRRNLQRATDGAAGARLAVLWQQIRGSTGHPVVVPTYRVEWMSVRLAPGDGQAQPKVLARVRGTVEHTTYTGSPPVAAKHGDPKRFDLPLQLVLQDGSYVIVRPAKAAPAAIGSGSASLAAGASGLAGVRLTDVAAKVGLDFRQGSFRYGVTADPVAMMGGGLCWLDYNRDGWLDLFVVNSYADEDYPQWQQHGGLPRSALFENRGGRFVDVSARSGADLAVRGTGCAAGDLNGDGKTDLYVTTGATSALLWNNGNGTFSEGAHAAGVDKYGWHSSAAVGDVNGDGRPDLFVGGYTDMNAQIQGSTAGFPTNHPGVRDLLYLNQGRGANGRSTFREVARQAGVDAAAPFDHTLGAVFSDLDRDGRLDLYVANDEDPNRLYENVPWPGGAKADPRGLGFRFEERAKQAGAADANAGMGIAAADYDGDGRADMFVTNSRDQLHAVMRGRAPRAGGASFTDARPDFASVLGRAYAGWGASWVDLDLDTDLDLVLANGAIPVLNLAIDASPSQVLGNLTAQGHAGQVADAEAVLGPGKGPIVNGRGLAAADYDNDGDIDIAINSIGGPLVLLRNTGATGHWLEVKLGTFAPGAVVTARLPDGRTLVREVQAGSSYLSSEDPRVQFGLGDATKVSELVVRFPGGGVTRLTDLPAGQIVTVPPPPG